MDRSECESGKTSLIVTERTVAALVTPVTERK